MATLAFDVFWRDRGASKGLQGLGKDASKAHGDLERFRTIGPRLGTAFGAFVGLDVFSGFIADARESAKIGRVTEAVIKSTGGAAHVTADQVGDLATSISNKTGADDEAVQSGANMLLTFTNVRNEVGKGNDIFNQASSTIVDMAAAMNNGEVTTDGMKTASIQLGKALNDPVKGVTALQKVGVTFTAQQKEQIKTLVASGHTLEAQKIVLGELNKEFGGTAAAAADPMQRLTVIVGNLGEQLGGALLPAVDSFANFMANTGAPAISAFVEDLQNVPAPAYAAAAGLVAIVGGVKVGKSVMEDFRAVSTATSVALKWLGLRSVEAAAAEGAQTAAAGTAAGATSAYGAAASRTTLAVQALSRAAVLAGGVAGLAYLSTEVTGYLGNADVAKVKTNDLASSLLQMQRSGQVGGAAVELFGVKSASAWGSIDTGTDALRRFGEEASGAFSMGIGDIIGRAQSGSERLERFNATAGQLDAALAQMAGSGHAKEAAGLFDQLTQATGLSGEELQHVINRFPQYRAAADDASAATARATAGAHDEGSAWRDLSRQAPRTTSGVKRLGEAHKGTTLSAKDQAKAEQEVIDKLRGLSDATLQARQGDRQLIEARNDLTTSLQKNGKTLNINTKGGRANADALDNVARQTRDATLAHRDAGEPLARYKRRVDQAKASLIEEARRAGMSKTAARKYAEAILAVPIKQSTEYKVPGLKGARGQVQGLKTDIAKLGNKHVNVAVTASGDLVERVASGPNRNKPIQSAFATGGRIPGWSPHAAADNVPIWATADEHMWSVREVRGAGGHGAVARLRALAAAGQLQGLARGGPVVDVTATGGFRRAHGGLDRWEDQLLLATAKTAGQGGGGYSGPIPGGSGVARWAPMVSRMLATVGLASSLQDNFLRQIATESGGNPNAVQGNIGDVNNLSGDLAKGLLQVIGATFRAYHWPGTSWSQFDPWANMTASGNYVKHRYPNPEAVIGHGHGYDRGGMAYRAGLVPKLTNQPERWLSPRQTAIFERAMGMAAAGHAGGGAQVIELHVHLPSYLGREEDVLAAMDRWSRRGQLTRIVRQASA